MPAAGARLAEARDVGVPDPRALDQRAHRLVAVRDHLLDPEDRLVGERSHRQREGPRSQPRLGAGDAQRRDLEAALDLDLASVRRCR